MRQTVALAITAFAIALLAACSEGNVFSLEVGQCFEDPGSATEVSSVETLECDAPHDLEVYALFDLTGDDFPGELVVEESAVQGCYLQFSDYVGRDYETSMLDFSWLVPTSRSWGDGDREVVCTLYDVDERPLTGSMKDSGV
jgi:Septum formation